jgi:hypothetical protein
LNADGSHIQVGFSVAGAGWWSTTTKVGTFMAVLDLALMALMGVLVVIFAGDALLEWWDERGHDARPRT